MIWRYQPYAVDKRNFGKIYNAHCESAKDDSDWIQITDRDAMILCDNTYKVIEEAIFRYSDTAIFGAMTNRCAYLYQTVLNKVDDNFDMRWHTDKAEQLADRFADGECLELTADGNPIKAVAGFFLLFRKSYWNNCKFQDTIIAKYKDTVRLFDSAFCEHARVTGQKIRIIKGAYIFHQYRMNKDWRNKDHLKIENNG